MGKGGGSDNITDLALLGSSIASAKYVDNASTISQPSSGGSVMNPYATANFNPKFESSTQQFTQPIVSDFDGIKIEVFDPETWDGGGIQTDDNVKFESIPHDVVVEWDKANDRARFKAVNRETGEELIGCPVPTSDPSKLSFNEKDMIVKGQFDETYKLELI